MVHWQERDYPHLMGMDQDACLFEAVIVPHRSLSPRALAALLGVIVVLAGATAAAAVSQGAWPVGGFTIIELGLAALLFRLNARAAREAELILLSESGLRIIRTDAKGSRRETVLSPQWLRVRLTDRPGRVPLLSLAARGADEEIGRCLGEGEKRELAAALEEALHRWRNPRFDNPQLRDEERAIISVRPASTT
jgi:uncharacterized membrane protein